jgi:hypothetical protein
VVDGKLKPLNASVKAPRFDDWDCGDDILPNEDVRSCWAGAGCGFGAVAYRDKIDCLRSGLDIPVDPPVVGAALPERLAGVDWLLPKKSNPNNESAGLVCFAAGWAGA